MQTLWVLRLRWSIFWIIRSYYLVIHNHQLGRMVNWMPGAKEVIDYEKENKGWSRSRMGQTGSFVLTSTFFTVPKRWRKRETAYLYKILTIITRNRILLHLITASVTWRKALPVKWLWPDHWIRGNADRINPAIQQVYLCQGGGRYRLFSGFHPLMQECTGSLLIQKEDLSNIACCMTSCLITPGKPSSVCWSCFDEQNGSVLWVQYGADSYTQVGPAALWY